MFEKRRVIWMERERDEIIIMSSIKVKNLTVFNI